MAKTTALAIASAGMVSDLNCSSASFLSAGSDIELESSDSVAPGTLMH
ncbi:hypothetical protein SYJ56_25445 [Algoriphagus sp. D3-2-R+10]|nr:hypothetical protein [Algoriphagus sp. D3-2-R+10]MEB2778678.1 hypothetical protein [Algoriphagus sp. D3-2-R+10]